MFRIGSEVQALEPTGPVSAHDDGARFIRVLLVLVPFLVEGIERARQGLGFVGGRGVPARCFGVRLGLLGFAPTRIVVAGVWSDWPEATPQAVGTFLESWRHSRFELLRSAYAALHDLVFGAFYAGPETWSAIGYPGPPKVE